MPVRLITTLVLLTLQPIAASAAADGEMRRWLAMTRDGRPLIERPDPEARGGYAYRLVYRVDAPVDVYWRFKTDFQNDFLLSNRNIVAHRLVSRKGAAAVTENRYAAAPDALFRWRTLVNAKERTLTFYLMNPEANGHRYHHGKIRVISHGGGVLVVQEAYFDFFGAGVWTRYPWAGGMNAFLDYTATWERETVKRLRFRYDHRDSETY